MKTKGNKESPKFAFMHGQTNTQAKKSMKLKGILLIFVFKQSFLQFGSNL